MPKDTRMDPSQGDYYNEKTGQKIELLASAKNAPSHLKEYVQEPKPTGVSSDKPVISATEQSLIDRVKAKAAEKKASEKKGGKSRRRHRKRRGTRRHHRR